MSCPDLESLRTYASAPGPGEIADHVNACKDCRRSVDTLMRDGGTLPPTPGPATEAFELTPEQRDQLHKEIVPTIHFPPAPNGSAAPLPTVPDYEVLEELGRGGMGVVYKARQMALNRLVALKLILAGGNAGPETRMRFQREAEAIARLQHPNIVQVYDVDEFEGRPFISMEYVGGGSLAQQLVGQPLEPRLAAELLRVLALAVHHAHAAGIVHCDLKPANILRDASGAPKIGDFGLARLSDRSDPERRGAVVGTPQYMAPEQADGQTDQIGPPADVWALGAILYEGLTGRPPFQGADTMATLQQVRRDPVVPPRQLNSRVPRDLEAICLKCLEKGPARRYGTAQELADDLFRFLDGVPVHARRVTTAERALKFARRNPTLTALLLLSLIAPTVVAILTLNYSAQLRKERDKANELAAALEKRNRDLRRAEYRRLVRDGLASLASGALAGAAGQFTEARSLTDDPHEQHECEIDRLRCYFAFEHWDRLEPELARLEKAMPDLDPRLKGRLLLYRGYFEMWHAANDRQQLGRARVEEALRAPGGLGPCEQALARALVCDGSRETISHLERAIAPETGDPFHLQAHSCLLFEYLTTGQFAAARQHAALMARVFPGEPAVPLALAFMAIIEGDEAASKPHRARLARLVGPHRMADLDRSLDLMAFAINWPDTGLLTPVATLFFRPANLGLVRGLGLPLAGRWEQVYRIGQAAHDALRRFDDVTAEKVLAPAIQRSPEALFRVQMATIHMIRAGKAANVKDLFAQCRELMAFYRESDLAASGPTIAPTADHRHVGAWGRGMAVALRNPLRREAFVIAAQAVTPGPLLVRLVNVSVARKAVETINQLPGEASDLLALTQPQGRHRDVRASGMPLIVEHAAPDDARLLLLAWSREEPTNVEPCRWLAHVERKNGNFALAIHWAERGLRLSPHHVELQRLWIGSHRARAARMN